MTETLQELFKKLKARPRYSYEMGSSHKNKDALQNVEQTIKLAEETWKLYHCTSRQEQYGIDSTELEILFTRALDYGCRVYFDRAIGFSDPSLWFFVTKERIVEGFLEKPNATDSLYQSLDYLNRILEDDLRDAVAFRGLYLILRTTCFRAIGMYEQAVESARICAEEDSVRRMEAYVLLSQCYCDSNRYIEAVEAAAKAIGYANRNTASELTAWRNRANIHQSIGNALEAARDNRRADELEQILKHRFSN